jgi:hypothetical protein
MGGTSSVSVMLAFWHFGGPSMDFYWARARGQSISFGNFPGNVIVFDAASSPLVRALKFPNNLPHRT